MKVKRIFHKNGKKKEIVSDVPNREPSLCPKIVTLGPDAFEFTMYANGSNGVDWDFHYSPIKVSAVLDFSASDVEDLGSILPPTSCDCGGNKSSGLHSYWCSTQKDTFHD